jgi:hypothetical protein
MKKTIFWVVGLGLVGYYILTRRSLAKNITFDISDVKFKGTALKPIIQIFFSVQNPTNQKATLKGLNGKILFNGSPFANVTNFVEQTILPRQETIISIDVKPSIMGLSSTIIDIIRGRNRGGNISFEGSANVDGILLPIVQSYDLK